MGDLRFIAEFRCFLSFPPAFLVMAHRLYEIQHTDTPFHFYFCLKYDAAAELRERNGISYEPIHVGWVSDGGGGTS